MQAPQSGSETPAEPDRHRDGSDGREHADRQADKGAARAAERPRRLGGRGTADGTTCTPMLVCAAHDRARDSERPLRRAHRPARERPTTI